MRFSRTRRLRAERHGASRSVTELRRSNLVTARGVVHLLMFCFAFWLGTNLVSSRGLLHPKDFLNQLCLLGSASPRPSWTLRRPANSPRSLLEPQRLHLQGPLEPPGLHADQLAQAGLRFSRTLLGTHMRSRALLDAPRALGSSRGCWVFPGARRRSWAPVGAPRRSWALLGSWAVPGAPESSWAFLGAPGRTATLPGTSEVAPSRAHGTSEVTCGPVHPQPSPGRARRRGREAA